MEEIPISKFKATCLAVIRKVRKTGKSVLVTRFGKPVAQITAVQTPRKWIDLSALRALTDMMPVQRESARDLVRRLRDQDRY